MVIANAGAFAIVLLFIFAGAGIEFAWIALIHVAMVAMLLFGYGQEYEEHEKLERALQSLLLTCAAAAVTASMFSTFVLAFDSHRYEVTGAEPFYEWFRVFVIFTCGFHVLKQLVWLLKAAIPKVRSGWEKFLKDC